MIEFNLREMGFASCDSAGIPDANSLFESLLDEMTARSEKLNEPI
jgi:hypothetical protein